MGRVFVPLVTQSYNDFKCGKRWEIRRLEKQWNPRYVRKGHDVILSKGYSGERMEASIGKVLTGSLRGIFARVSFREIEPRAKSEKEAIEMNAQVLGRVSKYIAFEILPRKRDRGRY